MTHESTVTTSEGHVLSNQPMSIECMMVVGQHRVTSVWHTISNSAIATSNGGRMTSEHVSSKAIVNSAVAQKWIDCSLSFQHSRSCHIHVHVSDGINALGASMIEIFGLHVRNFNFFLSPAKLALGLSQCLNLSLPIENQVVLGFKHCSLLIYSSVCHSFLLSCNHILSLLSHLFFMI